jgi:putative ABC transport system ATP-binding protein
MKKILEAVNLEKSYQGRKIIKGISLDVFEGEFVSLMGESGSGKSTLLYLLAGIEVPEKGKVFIDGHEITAMDEKQLAKMRTNVFSFVFQFDNLLPNLSLYENIMLPLVVSRSVTPEKQKEAQELIKYIGIEEVKDKRPSEVSGGEQQRASIARALIISPKIVFLDEPTGSLDSATNAQVMELLERINKEKGVTLVQVTHSERNAERTERIIRMQDGVLING